MIEIGNVPKPLLTTILLSLLMLPFVAHAESSDVRVTNFPKTQQVRGSVAIEETTKAVKLEGILLSNSRRNELSEVYHAGKIDTDGYTSISLFLQGEIKSTTFPSGTIGVVMVPDEEPILRALKESKQIQFPIETACMVKSGESEYFSCQQSGLDVGFPHYKIYLYNTLNKSVEANVYIYLRK